MAGEPAAGGLPDRSLAGSVALVTGAGRGLGSVLARGLSEAGASVGLLGRSQEALEAVARSCPGPTAVALADVTDPTAVRRAVTTVEDALGPVDLLVNNAGRIEASEVRFGDADLDELWSVVEVNLRGVLNVTSAVLASMRGRGGRIVDVGSGFGFRPMPVYTGYALSKGAVGRFTELLALQHRDEGIRAFAVTPGAVATDMTAGMPMFAGRGDWTDPQRMVDLVVAVGRGLLDDWSGRFLHARVDDPDGLRAAVPRVLERDARVLRMRLYGDDDPLD